MVFLRKEGIRSIRCTTTRDDEPISANGSQRRAGSLRHLQHTPERYRAEIGLVRDQLAALEHLQLDPDIAGLTSHTTRCVAEIRGDSQPRNLAGRKNELPDHGVAVGGILVMVSPGRGMPASESARPTLRRDRHPRRSKPQRA